jgi:hypothetical protein
MKAKQSRSGRTIKPVTRHDGELKTAQNRKSAKAKPTKHLNELELELENESGLETSSEGISAASKQNLIIVENNPDVFPSPKTRNQRPETPPDQYLPMVSIRILIKCNGTPAPTTKMLKVDFNDTYNNFYQAIIPKIYAKAGEVYDQMSFDPQNITLKYALITNTRAASLSKKPLQLNEYCDLDDASDFEALQLEMRRLHSVGQQRRGASDSLDNRTLQFHATLIKPNRTQLESSDNDSNNELDLKQDNVSLTFWTFC